MLNIYNSCEVKKKRALFIFSLVKCSPYVEITGFSFLSFCPYWLWIKLILFNRRSCDSNALAILEETRTMISQHVSFFFFFLLSLCTIIFYIFLRISIHVLLLDEHQLNALDYLNEACLLESCSLSVIWNDVCYEQIHHRCICFHEV